MPLQVCAVLASLVLRTLTVGPAAAPATGLRVFTFVDHTRLAHYRNGSSGRRVLRTYVHFPRNGKPPFPLVVFAHGFAVTPGLYAPLIDAWTRAGYVVAAPVFPVENAHAPGGPDEADLENQPGDMRFVITRMLSALPRLVDPHRIAVAGQSDGGETALAVADDPRFRDPRVRAAVILSGAELPGGPDPFPAGGPALLAVQGTADRINPAKYTIAFFDAARRPKFLLTLLGAGHLPPYSSNRRQLAVVARVTIAFLDRYLNGAPLSPLLAAAAVSGVARLGAEP